jgi:hypothetical protein
VAEVRIQATRQGWCHAHVQAIIVAIDQYAEAALGSRSYFLNTPYGAGVTGATAFRDGRVC